MGSNVPPMTPKRLGFPTVGFYGPQAGTPWKRARRLSVSRRRESPRQERLHPLPEPRRVLFVVLGPGLDEPLLSGRRNLREGVPLHQHHRAGRPVLGLHREQLDVFFFNDTATTEIYTLSLHDALPI